MFDFEGKDERPEAKELLRRIKGAMPELEERLSRCGPEGYEDAMYRFYHQSLKAYRIQDLTQEIAAKLRPLSPHGPSAPLNEWFETILAEGTGRKFSTTQDNKDWPVVTRPMFEAFFHARYFLEMAVRHGRELDAPLLIMPSGWASVLYLYGLR